MGQYVQVVSLQLSGWDGRTDKQMKDPQSENALPSLTKSLVCSSTNTSSLFQFSQWQYKTCRKIDKDVR